MKSFVFSVLSLIISIQFFSCQKTATNPDEECAGISRKIRFKLYTEDDFSAVDGRVTFTLSIQKSNRVLWDSVLPPMRIKDVPHLENMLVIDKWVPGNDPSRLKAGFIYYIDNVGLSWYWSRVDKCQLFKTVEFNFK